ncbi:MAG: hypothetical protein CPDRYMAC_6382 [uncultured Paraburkholderia sp.]|nr:MAG: hypothetical protein CPDRYDRY_6280 [uncultured Paraburkholderia sp.]CAH2944209.1 MAG: hypothetical protein CPDRYMAC_6382 [uncultured Paraburkholderia sp.]
MNDFDDDKRLKVIGEQLSVLPDATAESLEAACAANDYTHVHILVHGVEIASPYDQRFGLALHSGSDPSGYEAVSSERLATILRTPRENQAGQFTRLAVVTLASCNGGNVGTVSGVRRRREHRARASRGRHSVRGRESVSVVVRRLGDAREGSVRRPPLERRSAQTAGRIALTSAFFFQGYARLGEHRHLCLAAAGFR